MNRRGTAGEAALLGLVSGSLASNHAQRHEPVMFAVALSGMVVWFVVAFLRWVDP